MNASWVEGYREVRKFIVAPSPIADSVAQFWRSIYDRNSLVVVALNELVDETGKPYVPQKKGQKMVLEDMTIELDNIRRLRHSCHSAVLKLKKEGGDEKSVILIAYNGWGQMSYPQRPSDILDLMADMNHMREVLKKKAVEEKKLDDKQNIPITLVCFDGFSRSCTLAALDILCQRLQATHAIGTPFVDILDVIARLRMLRGAACMVSEFRIWRASELLFLSSRKPSSSSSSRWQSSSIRSATTLSIWKFFRRSVWTGSW